MNLSPKYLLIGNGKLVKHLSYYFSFMNISHAIWHRKMRQDQLENCLLDSEIVLIAISDSSIESFIDFNNSHLKDKILIHFSGALVTKKAFGVHPLMTFSHQLYDIDFYKTILFSLDEEAPEFYSLFPNLPNPHIRIPSKLKPFYHAICVMANNFTCILWEKFFRDMEVVFGAKPKLLHNFLERTTLNILDNPQNCLTGPLERNDTVTIDKNLSSLSQDPFKSVYEGFVDTYNKLKSKHPS